MFKGQQVVPVRASPLGVVFVVDAFRLVVCGFKIIVLKVLQVRTHARGEQGSQVPKRVCISSKLGED